MEMSERGQMEMVWACTRAVVDVRAAGQEAKRVTKETYGCGERGYEDQGVRVGDGREGEGWKLKGELEAVGIVPAWCFMLN